MSNYAGQTKTPIGYENAKLDELQKQTDLLRTIKNLLAILTIVVVLVVILIIFSAISVNS